MTPDVSSPQYQSYLIQKNSLQEQLANMLTIRTSTQASLSTQMQQLELQKSNSKNLLDSQKRALTNLKSQKVLSTDDLDEQISNLEDQVKSIERSKEILVESRDLQLVTIETNLKNMKSQIYQYLDSAVIALDKDFGATSAYASINDSYEMYVSVKNSDLKNKINTAILDLYREIENPIYSGAKL